MSRLVIVGVSAMQAWDGGAKGYARPSLARSSSALAETSDELAGFTTLPQGCTLPVEIMVSSDSHRVRSTRWMARRRSTIRPGTLWDIGGNRFLVSPEEFFLKRAPKLSVVEAVLLGMELCGWYSTLMSAPYKKYRDEYIRENGLPLETRVWPPANWDLSLQHQRDLMELGFVKRRPLTSAKEIWSYLKRCLSENSNSRAVVASRLLRDGSRSPMESRLFARYCLPRRHGGLNLNPVELNAEIQLTDEIAAATGKRKYSVDLYWPKSGIAIEYEGSHAHSGVSVEARDRLKRNILEAKGIRIISVDKAQYAREELLEFHGVEIAKSMGIKPETLAPNARELKARNMLIDSVGNWDVDLYRP